LSETLAIEALYRALHVHLAGLCGGKHFPFIAPPTTPTPFIIYGFESGGEADRRRRDNQTLTMTVKCIADQLEDSLMNARQIRDLLRDQGDQEGATFPPDAEWRFTTISQGLLGHLYEEWEDGRVFYHAGHQYTFTMERKTDG